MRGLGAVSLVLLLAGCVEPDGQPANVRPTVDDAVRDHLEAFIAGDLDGFLAFYSADWVDLGGGDGTRYTLAERRSDMAEYYQSTEYRSEVRGRTPQDLLVMEEARFLAYAEYNGNPNYDFGVPERFRPQPLDVLVLIDPTEGSPLFDGWNGYYRPTTTSWVAVAGD